MMNQFDVVDGWLCITDIGNTVYVNAKWAIELAKKVKKEQQ